MECDELKDTWRQTQLLQLPASNLVCMRAILRDVVIAISYDHFIHIWILSLMQIAGIFSEVSIWKEGA